MNKRPEISNTPSQIRIPIIISITLAIGILIGATFLGSSKVPLNNVSKGLSKYREILSQIENNYVDSVNTDSLVDYSIVKMLEKLDPHTSYLNVEEAAASRSQLESSFDGIGVEFSIFNDTVHVVTPLQGGPSEQVGIQSGDILLNVNGEALSGPGVTNSKVFKLLRGPRGTEVKLDVVRKSLKEPLTFSLKRDKIPTYSVDAAYMVNNEIGYLKINRFSETTYEEFKTHLSKLVDQGMTKLILDLRGNPGGYLERAVNIADEFLSDDKLIVYTKGKRERLNKESKAQHKGIFEKGPVIVLVDEGSASASEIVAGALQDHDRGLIIGRRTFGKGLVQMPQRLSDGSELRITISRYYIPSGRSIQKPYELGNGAAYEQDLSKRITSGELFHADSVHLDTSHVYKTAAGRKVYGGGGVMPDIFIPRDSTTNTKYLYELYAKNVIREFAAQTAQNLTTTYSDKPFKTFLTQFSVSDQLLNQLKSAGQRAGVPFNEQEFVRSKPQLQVDLKALIARYLFGKKREDGLSNEVYQVLNSNDAIFKAALQQFPAATALENGGAVLIPSNKTLN